MLFFRFPRFSAAGFAAVSTLFLGAVLGAGSGVSHAQTVSGPFVFTYTGADQFFFVPTGVTQLQVQLFGAGGGSFLVAAAGAAGATQWAFLISRAGRTSPSLSGAAVGAAAAI